MSNSAEQVTRLLALVPYLNTHHEVHVEEAARTFGVTPKQLIGDLRVLWFCGLPGLASAEGMDIDFDAIEEGDGRIRLSNADYLSRPTRLGADEASALILALRALAESTAPEGREVIERTLAKLEAATAGAAAEHVIVPSQAQSASAQVRRDLAGAINAGRQVHLDYYVPTRDESTSRIVDPLELVTREDVAYLDAWCHRAEGRRLFRLDRVHALTVLDSPVEPRDLEPLRLSEGLFDLGPDATLVSLRLQPPVRWVAEYYPVVASQEGPEDSLEVTLRVSDPRWLVRLMLRLAPYAEVVGPAEEAVRVREAAAAALAAYDGCERLEAQSPGRRSR